MLTEIQARRIAEWVIVIGSCAVYFAILKGWLQ